MDQREVADEQARFLGVHTRTRPENDIDGLENIRERVGRIRNRPNDFDIDLDPPHAIKVRVSFLFIKKFSNFVKIKNLKF